MERPDAPRVPHAGSELRTDAVIAAVQALALVDLCLEGWLDRLERRA